MSYPDELTPEFGLTVAAVLCVVWLVMEIRAAKTPKQSDGS